MQSSCSILYRVRMYQNDYWDILSWYSLVLMCISPVSTVRFSNSETAKQLDFFYDCTLLQSLHHCLALWETGSQMLWRLNFCVEAEDFKFRLKSSFVKRVPALGLLCLWQIFGTLIFFGVKVCYGSFDCACSIVCHQSSPLTISFCLSFICST